MGSCLNLQMYDVILNEIKSLGHRPKGREVELRLAWTRLPEKSIRSIFFQEYQRQMKETHPKFNQADQKEALFQQYCERKQAGKEDVLLELADDAKISFSPVLLARFILEKHVTEVAYEGFGDLRSTITKLLNNTSLIKDSELALEVEQCVMEDEMYGPAVDCTKRCLGLEYERKLEKILKDKGLWYLSEDGIRKRGYDKTPDFILEVPIAVEGRMVSWVESKALFGDPICHNAYLKEQLWCYRDRFGSGMVLYWFGFVEELDCNRDKGIMVMDHFPDEITAMNCGPITDCSTDGIVLESSAERDSSLS